MAGRDTRSHMYVAIAILIMACSALAAPIHIVLPDVVTLQGGTAVTLYSPPLPSPESSQTNAIVDDTILSINQDMLLHALVPSINPDDHDDPPNTAPDIRADLAFDHTHNRQQAYYNPLIAARNHHLSGKVVTYWHY
ncbi:hypothetical protein H4218_006242 [Coemansia sp. IMI 209128]|nr:hypothetical protein H4218_006242 [Coemansia sp. IMI 209128]